MSYNTPGICEDANARVVVDALLSSFNPGGQTEVATRIRSLDYLEAGYRVTASVGHPLESEIVFCILETQDGYLIYTPTRGLRRGMPILVDRGDAVRVERL